MPFLRPDADSVDGNWTTESAGADLWAAIDETSASDTDYIRSGTSPTNDICRVTLSNPSGTVDTASAVTVRYRYRKTGTDTMDLVVRLKEGTTTRATWTHSGIADTWVTAAQVLDAGVKSAITDWTNLLIEFEANSALDWAGNGDWAANGDWLGVS